MGSGRVREVEEGGKRLRGKWEREDEVGEGGIREGRISGRDGERMGNREKGGGE